MNKAITDCPNCNKKLELYETQNDKGEGLTEVWVCLACSKIYEKRFTYKFDGMDELID